MTKTKPNPQGTLDKAEAFFDVELPEVDPYMNNVLLTFVYGIPIECYGFCVSEESKRKNVKIDDLPSQEQKVPYLVHFVRERLMWLADYEYLTWINGQTPFITPRELQIWRLRQFVQFIWFWEVPDDEDLALIFNLTKIKASTLASDFSARFRKTILYPVSLRRFYYLINNSSPVFSQLVPSAKSKSAEGYLYKVPRLRYEATAKFLAEDIRSELPTNRIAEPYLADKDLEHLWIDLTMEDVIKTNRELMEKLFKIYKIP